MIEKMFKKGITRKLFSVVLVAAMVVALMPMNSMTAYAYDSLPTELNGLSVVWSAGWQIDDGEITCGHLASISEYGSCCGIADAQNVLPDGISELHAGTYHCSGGSCTFTLSAAGGSGSGTTTWVEVNLGGKHFWYDSSCFSVETPGGYIVYICDVDNGVLEYLTYLNTWERFNNCAHMTETDPASTPAHTHGNWSYTVENTSTLKATCGKEGCDDTAYSVSLTLTASSANYSGSAISKSDIFGTMDFTAFNDATEKTLSVDDIKLYASDDTSKEHPLTEITASGNYVAELKVGDATATCNVLIPEMTYTITIPATVSVDKEGFNAFGDGITVSGLQNIASDKAGLKVSASSANEWKLVNEDSNEVRYGLRESASSNENVTEFKFAKDDITSESGKTIACGVFINAEDFENAPAGDYIDIITWTVSTYSE